MLKNLHTHFQGDTIKELTSLVERVCDSTSTKVSTEPFTPRVLSPEELAQAEEAHFFDLRSDFDQMYGREEFEEEACD